MNDVHAAGEQLLLSNLALVERIIRFICRRHRLDSPDCDEFGAIVKLKLVEDDYAVLRAFEGRSALSTYLSIVIERVFLDDHTRKAGKFHPSAVAKRLGKSAVDVERLMVRGHRTFDEAVAILQSQDPALTAEQLESIRQQLPSRAPMRRTVELEQAGSLETRPEEPHAQAERNRVADKVSVIVCSYIDSLTADDRLVLNMRFDGGMSVADIGRSLRTEQKHLYRRLEKHLRELRKQLEESGIDAEAISEIVGDRSLPLDFHLEKASSRPSNPNDVAMHKEVPQ